MHHQTSSTHEKFSHTPSFGLITPSYAPDFERCAWLCSTRAKFLPAYVKHYVLVDQRDIHLFKQLECFNIELIAVEDILPWWIQRIPLLKQGWFSFKTFPIRNWLLQQIVKLRIAEFISEEILCFVDSDVAFVRPFDPQSFLQNGKVRFYRESYSIPEEWKNFKGWYQAASDLLDIPNVTYPAPNYVGDLISWKRDNVLKLHRHIEKKSGRHWIETIANNLNLSEYILYGMFVEHILGDKSGHYFDEKYRGLHYFGTKELSKSEIQEFLSRIEPHHVTVMISAKAGIPVTRYQDLLNNLSSSLH